MRHAARPDAGLAGHLAVALAMALGATACTSPPPGTASPAPSATPSAATPLPGGPEPAVSAGPPSATVAVEDPSLVLVLPAEVDGHPVEIEPYAFSEALADPAFATSIAAAAFGVVASGDNLASAVVARPAGGPPGEPWLRAWRDTYDEGACGRAGGVAATAEAQLGGRVVHIASCAGGLRTYHAWIPERGLLVSAFAIGDARFGERLMEGLRP